MANTGALNRRKRKRIRKSSRKRWQKKNPEDEDPILFGGAIDGEENRPSSSHHSDEIRDVLETRTKDELIEILLDAVASDVDLFARVLAAADNDVARRKVFVHGLGPDATREALLEAFRLHGSVEECNLVVDKATGHAKGYGFVLFSYKTVEGARKTLEEPFKMFEGHRLYCAKAVSPSQKKKAPAAAITTSPAALLGPTPRPVLAAVAAAQNYDSSAESSSRFIAGASPSCNTEHDLRWNGITLAAGAGTWIGFGK